MRQDTERKPEPQKLWEKGLKKLFLTLPFPKLKPQAKLQHHSETTFLH